MTEQDNCAAGVCTEKSVIDHLCFDFDLAARDCRVKLWDADLVGGNAISDHGGVFVDIAEK